MDQATVEAADSDGPEQADEHVIHPLRDFLHTEAAGGVVLVLATIVALIWANSPWKQSYEDLWHTDITIAVGSHVLELDLHAFVNDALMAIFFFVVGLEIKRELVEGELRDPRRASMPAIAAVGGMLVPAGLYLAFNAGGAGARGWGIPMATDIAMAVGVLSLLGSRVVPSLKLFVLALAIVDDIGAILVIALFYSSDIDAWSIAIAAALLITVAICRKLGVRQIPVYVLLGCATWLAVYDSGLHATLTGVALGLMAPTKPIRQRHLIDEAALVDVSTVDAAHESVVIARESVSVVEWLEYLLHPWTSFLILPLFALANAGIPLSNSALSNAASSAVTYGVLVGLVLGKIIGITAFVWLAAKLKVGVLPEGSTWRAIVGVAALCGIGFTVSIFVAGLAFDDVELQNDAKIGILVASLLAAVVGSIVLSVRTRGAEPDRTAPVA